MSRISGPMLRWASFCCVLACAPACGDKDSADTAEADDSAVEGDADADSDADTDADSDADSDTDTDADSDVGYAADIAPILNASCSPCHTSQTSGGLNMSGYDALVGAPSSADMPYVTAGDLDNSYMWYKLEGTQSSVGGTGVQMPRSGTISANDKSTIRTWIEGGALP